MKRKNSFVAPIIITILLILALLIYGLAWITIPFPIIIKLVIGVIFLALIGTAISVLVERIKEIRSGETDDLSKY